METTVYQEKIELTTEIERLRFNMNRLGTKHGLQHPEVMRHSQELDQLIVRFYLQGQSSASK